MSASEPLSDTLPVTAFLREQRREPRCACHIKTLYSRRGDREGLSQGEATWNIGRMVDVSRDGFGMVLQRGFVPGAVLCLEPLLPNWKRNEPLTARVQYVRAGPGNTLLVGCQFTKALDGDELQVLLTNGR